jgi:hypothetical protein
MLSLMARTKLVATTIACLLVVAAACGGGVEGDAPSHSLPAGEITCEQLYNKSYQYAVKVDFDVGPQPTGETAPTGVGRSPYHFTTTVDNAKVEKSNRLAASIHNTDGHNRADYQAIQWDDNTAFLKLAEEQPWRQEDTSVRPISFPYWPMSLCDALRPDIDTTTFGEPVREDVRGIKTEKYEFSGLPNDFFKRAPDFGSGSDFAAYTSSVGGTIWISETGKYPAKIELSAQGNYPSGQLLTVNVTLEVWDMGGDIKIEQPPLPTG